MLRFFIFFILFISSLHSQIHDVELLAKNVIKNGELIEANGDVLVFSDEYLISANKAIYNEKNGDLELFGDVSVLRGVKESLRAEYAKMNLRQDTGEFKPLFYSDSESKIWLDCKSAKLEPKFYLSKDAVVSSCNVDEPDWKIGFSKSYLNRDSKFLHLYNAVFYIKDMPFMYFPYFSFSTDKTRRTGLLRPDFGYSKVEGLYYSQPFYLAAKENWDLEIAPQIRTNRGSGLYSNIRFIDSEVSKGSISAGVFQERDKYKKRENLKNKEHYGLEFEYKRQKLATYFLSDSFKEGLWINATYLNDIDYLNMKDDKNKNLDPLVTSRLNYYLSDSKNYFGLYSKYYIDTKKTSNKSTLQELPSIQYHRFSDNLYFSNLLYSFDMNYNRYTRKEGVGANQFEFLLPIGFHFSFLEDYLNFSISENIYATWVGYENDNNLKNDKFSKNFHKISLYTDLAKAYDGFFHTMYFGVDYIVPSWDSGEISQDFISTEVEPRQVKLSLINFLYDKDAKKRLKHSLKQALYFDDNYDKYGDLENELSLYISDEFSIQNEIHYSHNKNRLSRIQTQLKWEQKDYKTKISHIYENKQYEEKENFISAGFDFKITKDYDVFSKIDYSIENDYIRLWQTGIGYHRKCWEFSFRYKEELSPKLTSAGSDYVTRRGFYFLVNFLPIGGVKYDYTIENKMQ